MLFYDATQSSRSSNCLGDFLARAKLTFPPSLSRAEVNAELSNIQLSKINSSQWEGGPMLPLPSTKASLKHEHEGIYNTVLESVTKIFYTRLSLGVH